MIRIQCFNQTSVWGKLKGRSIDLQRSFLDDWTIFEKETFGVMNKRAQDRMLISLGIRISYSVVIQSMRDEVKLPTLTIDSSTKAISVPSKAFLASSMPQANKESNFRKRGGENYRITQNQTWLAWGGRIRIGTHIEHLSWVESSVSHHLLRS